MKSLSEKSNLGHVHCTLTSEPLCQLSYTDKAKERAGFEPTNPKEAILSRSHLTTLLPLPTHNNPLPGIEPEATG